MRSQDSQLSLLPIGLFSLIPTQVSKNGTSIWQWRQMRIMRLIDSFDLRLFLSPLALGLARSNVHSSHLFPRLAWGHTSTCEDAEGTPPDHLTGEWKHIISIYSMIYCIQMHTIWNAAIKHEVSSRCNAWQSLIASWSPFHILLHKGPLVSTGRCDPSMDNLEEY